MSYILDALQRADQERNLGEVPKLDMALQPGRVAQRRGWIPTAVIIILIATIVAGTAWLYEQGRFSGQPVTEQPEKQVAETARVAVEQNRPVEAPSAAGQPESASSAPAVSAPAAAFDSVSSQPAQAPETGAPAQTNAQAIAAEPAVQPQPEPEVVATPQEPLETAEPETRSARLPTPTVAPAPPPNWMREEAAERLAQETAPRRPVQTYLGLPQSFRNSLPKMDMNAHVFSTNPSRSFVLINGKRYRIGDFLAEGPELVDILPDGAVLEFRNETFLFPVQR